MKSDRPRQRSDRVIRRAIASNVRKLRLARGWSVETLAARCKESPSYVTEVEKASRDELRVGDLEMLARVLKVDVVELVSQGKQERRLRDRSVNRLRASKGRVPKRSVP